MIYGKSGHVEEVSAALLTKIDRREVRCRRRVADLFAVTEAGRGGRPVAQPGHGVDCDKDISAGGLSHRSRPGLHEGGGIDLKLTFIEATPSIQTLMSGNTQFTASGTSALVALAKGGLPLKVVLAMNDRVLQWVLTKPNITSLKDLKGKKIATTGIAAATTFMLRQILTKQGSTATRM